MKETETKVIGIDTEDITSKLSAMGAKKVQDTLLTVDWFRKDENGGDDWFLRVRSYSDGKTEVTWKGKLEVNGASRTQPEINVLIDDHGKMKDIFEEIRK